MTYREACVLDGVEPDDRPDIDDAWKDRLDRSLKDGEWNVDDATYFADREAVSNSTLNIFREWRPTYHGVYVLGTMERKKTTAAMILGSAVHCLALERKSFNDRFAVAPECDKRTTVGKERWGAFVAESAGKTVLPSDGEYGFHKAAAMAEALRGNREFRYLLDKALTVEQPYRWRWGLGDGDTVLCRGKPDIVTTTGVIVDIKTTSDVTTDSWVRDAWKYGYHRQAAFYRNGLFAIDGEFRQFAHVAVGSYEPYPVVVYCLDEQSIDLGSDEVQADLTALRDCRISGDWRDPAEKRIQHVRLPQWAFQKGYAA